MPSLDAIRSQSEAHFKRDMKRLDAHSRRELKAALRKYGRVQDIPESVWLKIERRTEEEITTVMLLVMLAADGWTVGEVVREVPEVVPGEPGLAEYARRAADKAREAARAITDTTRERLTRKVEDARLSGPGGVGELTSEGIDEALGETLTDARRGAIAADRTTTAMSIGQIGGRDRLRQQAQVELIWKTELDNRVCPRCAPLDGTREEVWGQVFPDGPGEEAHPNCRCYLEPQVVVQAAERAA